MQLLTTSPRLLTDEGLRGALPITQFLSASIGSGHGTVLTLVRVVPTNEPAHAGARCAKRGRWGNHSGYQVIGVR